MTLPDDALAGKLDRGASFDREWTLEELLSAQERAELEQTLASLVGESVRLIVGAVAPPADGSHAAPLQLDIEPLGWLCGPENRREAVEAAARLLRRLLVARQRYQMASALHVESVREDYLALLEQHHALEASEARYRDLAAQLEARVREQVQIIETRQRQLYQTERLASVGQLAAGMAHEINNPIGFVRSNLNSARGYLKQFASALQTAQEGDGEVWKRIDATFLLGDFSELLQDCIDGVDRVAAIVRDLKGFSSVDRDEVAVIDLQASLDELCRLLASQLPKEARLDRTGEASRQFRCRPGPLQQALFNVLDNAIRAIGPGGSVTIRCGFNGDLQVIEVIDDGCGIEPEQVAKVFDPFFTTRPVGRGIGLGLTLARDVILAQGGRIELHSRPGEGTRVEMMLPLEGER